MFLGLTGNIGSGKTTVLGLFEKMGVSCFNSDHMVHAMFYRTHTCYTLIATEFDSILKTNFLNEEFIDRVKIRTITQTDSKYLPLLATSIKPYITDEILKLKDSSPFNTVIEVPLLFEQNIQHVFEKTLLVVCSNEERINRIKLRNPDFTENYIKKIISSQMSQEDKIKKADYIIKNDNSSDLNEEINKIISSFKKFKTSPK